jgi:hypothetical protein
MESVVDLGRHAPRPRFTLEVATKRLPLRGWQNSERGSIIRPFSPATKGATMTQPVSNSHTCIRVVKAATYLQSVGMSVQQLRAIHHSLRKTETFASTIRYFGQNKDLGDKNTRYAHRLEFIATEYQKSRTGFDALVSEALRRWPA